MELTPDIETGCSDVDAVFLFVNTPGEESGKFSTRDVLAACEPLGRALRASKRPPLVVLVSSVTAGSIEDEIIPELEKHSGLRAGSDFDVCYSPVFIALGSMVRNYIEPDFTLIGEARSQAGDKLLALLKDFYDGIEPPAIRANYVTAEVIKLTLSTFITTKITYANMIMELCDALPGADADQVSEALGLDKRISPKSLKGGMPYGGPCFPRDNRALLYLLRQAGVAEELVSATDEVNHKLIHGLASRLVSLSGESEAIGVLGVSFKPDTDVIEESASVALVEELLSMGRELVVYDPAALESMKKVFGDRVAYASSVVDLTQQVSTVVVATPWDEFRELPRVMEDAGSAITVVVDPWRLFGDSDFSADVMYQALGRSVLEREVSAAT